VCADPALIPGAVSESLRYDQWLGSIPRFTLEDIEIDGYRRTSQQHPQPVNAFRQCAIRRSTRARPLQHPADGPSARHLIFGLGVHRCLGEILARAELEESLAALTSLLRNCSSPAPPPSLQGHGAYAASWHAGAVGARGG